METTDFGIFNKEVEKVAKTLEVPLGQFSEQYRGPNWFPAKLLEGIRPGRYTAQPRKNREQAANTLRGLLRAYNENLIGAGLEETMGEFRKTVAALTMLDVPDELIRNAFENSPFEITFRTGQTDHSGEAKDPQLNFR